MSGATAAQAALGNTYGPCFQPVLDGLPDGPKKSMARAYRLQRLSADLLPGSRVGMCGMQAVRPGGAIITRNGDGAHGVTGVRRCGSGWICPVCAPKIARGRVAEIEKAVEAWHDVGGDCVMLTLTVQHHAGDELAGLIKTLAAAQRRLWSGRAAADRAKRWGIVGQIRNTEVTWGAGTGWHPHSHVLLFVRELSGVDGVQLVADLKQSWAAAVERSGWYASPEHGLMGQLVERRGVRLERAKERLAELALSAARLAEYFGKSAELPTAEALVANEWGPGHELSMAHLKRARGARYSPWALLIAAGEVTPGGDSEAAKDSDHAHATRLWQEFADATKGRVMIRWSQGLRDRLFIDDPVSDEALAEAAEDDTRHVARIAIGAWRRMVLQETAVKFLGWLDQHEDVPDDEVQLLVNQWCLDHGLEGW